MTMELQIALLSAISALVGTAIGGMISYFTTRYATTQQHRHETRVAEISKKEALFAEFLGEANRLLILSISSEKAPITQLEVLFSLESRIKIIGSMEIATAAVELGESLLELCVSREVRPNHNKQESDRYKNACKRFVDVARVELRSLKKSA